MKTWSSRHSDDGLASKGLNRLRLPLDLLVAVAQLATGSTAHDTGHGTGAHCTNTGTPREREKKNFTINSLAQHWARDWRALALTQVHHWSQCCARNKNSLARATLWSEVAVAGLKHPWDNKMRLPDENRGKDRRATFDDVGRS